MHYIAVPGLKLIIGYLLLSPVRVTQLGNY